MSFRIYDADGLRIGSVKYPMDAAILVAYQSKGATVRFGNRKWQAIYELQDRDNAQDSFDQIVMDMDDGIAKLQSEYKRRLKEGKTKRLRSLEKSLSEWAPRW